MSPNLAQCLLIARVVTADGMITEEERVFLNAALARYQLTKEERAQLVEMEGLDEAEKVVAKLDEHEKRDFVDTLLTAAFTDGRLSAHENDAIKRISKALGLE